jgi:potassium/chloride transporter 4/5/6
VLNSSFVVQDGFAEVSTTDGKFFEAVWSAVIHTGLGPLSPNTILLSFPCFSSSGVAKAERDMESYIRTLNGVLNLGKAVVLFKGSPNYPTTSTDISTQKCIDIWWIVYDGGLLLLLPFLLSKHVAWSNEEPSNKKGKNRLRRRRRLEAKLRLFVVKTTPTEDSNKLRTSILEHLENMRIQAEVVVIDDLATTDIAKFMRDSNSVGSHRSSSKENQLRKSKQFNRVASLAKEGISTHHMTIGEVFLESPLPEDVSATQYYGKDLESDMNGITHKGIETAIFLNRIIKKHSDDTSLVVTNLPFIPNDVSPKEYFRFVDAMLDGVDNACLVRGSGAEVITAIA